jgi:hypothetical protein
MSKPANHQLLNSSTSAEWFTPPCYIKAVREVLGAIDLDPASCEAANRTHESERPGLRHRTYAEAALSLFQQNKIGLDTPRESPIAMTSTRSYLSDLTRS